MKIGISINKLMNSFYTLPNITHEDNSDESNYIYVGKNSTMWDGIVNLAYRFSGRYPFIKRYELRENNSCKRTGKL